MVDIKVARPSGYLGYLDADGPLPPRAVRMPATCRNGTAFATPRPPTAAYTKQRRTKITSTSSHIHIGFKSSPRLITFLTICFAPSSGATTKKPFWYQQNSFLYVRKNTRAAEFPSVCKVREAKALRFSTYRN